LAAKYGASDARHDEAVAGFARIAGEGLRWVTSSFVLCETLNLLERFAGSQFAASAGRRICSSSLTLLEPEPADRLAALSQLEEYADLRGGYCDGVSFVMMRRLRLLDAFAFDRHVQQAGFRLWPGP